MSRENQRILLEGNREFLRKNWDDVKKGEIIYFQILTMPSDRYFGPFEVIDPQKGRLKLRFDTDANVSKKNLQPLVPYE